MKARKVISQGAKWRAGDGCDAKIFKDSWLPRTSVGSVISQNFSLPTSTIVSYLIDPITKDWDFSLTDSLFLPREAQIIKVIPLCSLPQKVHLYWPMENHGCYSVKLGYHAL